MAGAARWAARQERAIWGWLQHPIDVSEMGYWRAKLQTQRPHLPSCAMSACPARNANELRMKTGKDQQTARIEYLRKACAQTRVVPMAAHGTCNRPVLASTLSLSSGSADHCHPTACACRLPCHSNASQPRQRYCRCIATKGDGRRRPPQSSASASATSAPAIHCHSE